MLLQARIFGPSATTAISATSLQCRMRLPRASPRLSSRHWLPPSNSACCAKLDAWEAYQRGLWHFHKYRPEENKTAMGFFSQAIALDPNFAPGHYGYALALQWDIWHFSSRPFSEVQGTAREEAQIAVSLDDNDATAHAVLAHMMMWGSEWEAAIAEARTAAALNPNSAFVVSMLGCVLGFGGHRKEALERLQQAMRASPHDPLIWLWLLWRGVLQFLSRDFVAALRRCAKLFACVRVMVPLTNTSPRRSPISGNWTRRAKHSNVFPRNRRGSFSVSSKGRPGCCPRTMLSGSKVSVLQPECGDECDAAIRSISEWAFRTGVSDVLKFCNSRTGSSNRAADFRCWQQNGHPAAKSQCPSLDPQRTTR